MCIKKVNKKGFEISNWLIIEGLMISIAIIIVFQYIDGVKDDTLFEQKFLARDLALMTDTVSTVPGDIIYTYDHGKATISRFEYVFSKDIVDVRESGKDLASVYPFYYDSSLSPNFQIIREPKQIIFAKRGSSMDISTKITGMTRTEKCPVIDTKDTVDIVALDADNSDEAWKLADTMHRKYLATPGTGFHIGLTRQQDPALIDDRLDKISKATDVVISIGISDDETTRAYTSKNTFEQSNKLACLIIKNLNLQFPGMVSNRLPSDERIINKHGTGVKLEVVKSMQQNKIAAAIITALREYDG